MERVESANGCSAQVDEVQEESQAQPADEYGPNFFQSSEFMIKWNAIIQEFIEKAADQTSDRFDPAVAAGVGLAGNGLSILNEFLGEVLEDLPELNKVKADAEKSRAIFDRWTEKYKNFLETIMETAVSNEKEEIMTSWLNILQMNQAAGSSMFNPWMEALPQWKEQSEKFAKGDLSAIDEGFSLWREVYDETLGRLLKMPGLGLTKQHTEKANKTHAEFAQFATSLPYFYPYIYSTGIAALKEVSDKIQKLDVKKPTPETMRQIYQIWLHTNESAIINLFRRPDFCHTGGEVISCIFRLRKQLDDLTTKWCEAMAIPSSRDYDKMAMTIQDLRRKVRAQQKAMDALHEKLETN